MKICVQPSDTSFNIHKCEGRIYEHKGDLFMLVQVDGGIHKFINLEYGNRKSDTRILVIPDDYYDVTDQYCLNKIK